MYYISDMALYPADIVEQACIEYRRDSDSLYFPKVGKLLKLMNNHWYMRKWRLEKLKALLAVSNEKE